MNDKRILMAQKALEHIEKGFASGKLKVKKEEFISAAKIVRQPLFSAQYYPDLMSLRNYLKTQKFTETAIAFLKLFHLDGLNLKFDARILSGTERRLAYSDILSMVDTCYCELKSVTKHAKSKNLFVCNVDAGDYNSYYGGSHLKIVTNISGLKAGRILPLAFLPPREFFKIVSEGMFLGEAAPEGAVVGTRAVVSEHDAGTALTPISEYLNK